MANDYFQFKHFIVRQSLCAMKVCTDSCAFGALAAADIGELPQMPGSILDIGAGTGLLSLMLAQKTDARIDSVEMDPQAIVQMKENFDASPWSDRLHVIGRDIRFWQAEQLYDYIISNPPFYENDLKGNAPAKTMAMHDTGLLLSQLAIEIQKRLSPSGRFAILVPFARFKYMDEQLQQHTLLTTQAIHIRHSQNHKPFRSVMFGTYSMAFKNMKISELLITDNGAYSRGFRDLLQDYYLGF